MRKMLLALSLAFIGCNGNGLESVQVPVSPPSLLGLNETQAAVGDQIAFYGGNFQSGSGNVSLTFQGTYVHQNDPGEDDVTYTLKPTWMSGNEVDIGFFGQNFAIPFGNGRTLGTFQGTVTAYNIAPDGSQVASAPLPVSIQMLPSIIIDSFEPTTTNSCPSPAKRILGGFPYQIQVEAIGFTPINFTYQQVSPDFMPPPLRHPAKGTKDVFGMNNELFFPPVPASDSTGQGGSAFYETVFAISSLATNGNTYGVSYTFGVHNPIEYIPTGPPLVAEYEAPVPIGGCIPGNLYGGQNVEYTDTENDSRSRNVGYSWNNAQNQQTTGSWTNQQASTNSVNFNVTQGDSTNWEAGWSTNDTQGSTLTNGWSQTYGSTASATHNQTNNQSTTTSEHAGETSQTGTEGGNSNGTKTDVNGEGSILGVGGGGDTGWGNTVNTQSGGNSQTGITGTLSQENGTSNNLGQTLGTSYNANSNGSVASTMQHSVGQTGSDTTGEMVSQTVGSDHSSEDTESWATSDTDGQTLTSGTSGFWETSSSESIAVGTSYQLYPGFDGWWYRQTTRIAYPGQVIEYDLCSNPQPVAEANFYDYVWAVELAVGRSCDGNGQPTPATFPPAQCFIDCPNN